MWRRTEIQLRLTRRIACRALAVDVISFFKRERELELRICGNGVIKKTWEDTKIGNPVVRTPGFLGSATLPNVRTPYLRLRLPVIFRRVQRGEAKLAVNMAKLREYLALPQNVLAFSSHGLLTFTMRSIY
jgi:hypothetical protein